MNRIEDLFEPLPDPDEPTTPAAPSSLDDAVEQFGFDNVYAALLNLAAGEEEQR